MNLTDTRWTDLMAQREGYRWQAIVRETRRERHPIRAWLSDRLHAIAEWIAP